MMLTKEIKILHLKRMHHLSIAFQKLMAKKLIMQKIYIKIDNAEDLHVVMPMYNLLEYSKNYRKTTGSLWNYYRDEPSNLRSSNSESFKYKTNIVGKTPQNNDSLTNTKAVIPLK